MEEAVICFERELQTKMHVIIANFEYNTVVMMWPLNV